MAIAAGRLRALLVAKTELGERIMRALILRRVGLIGYGAGAMIIVTGSDPDVLRLVNFLRRNAHPYQQIDPVDDPSARTLVDRFRVAAEELPIVLCPGGQLLRCPSESALARCIGLVGPIDEARQFDVVIVGAGPAGLAAAVYAGSERCRAHARQPLLRGAGRRIGEDRELSRLSDRHFQNGDAAVDPRTAQTLSRSTGTLISQRTPSSAKLKQASAPRS